MSAKVVSNSCVRFEFDDSNVNFSKAGMYATEIFQRIWKESSPGISEFQGRFAPSLRGIRQTQTYSRHSHISKTHLSVDRVEII